MLASFEQALHDSFFKEKPRTHYCSSGTNDPKNNSPKKLCDDLNTLPQKFGEIYPDAKVAILPIITRNDKKQGMILT